VKTEFTLADFDFVLPDALIAQHPAETRSASRLLDGRQAKPIDRRFSDLPNLLAAGDLLLFNDTKVVKARLFGEKASGGKLEMLIERVLPTSAASGLNRDVVAHIKVSKKPAVGSVLNMAPNAQGEPAFLATLLGRWPDEDGALFRFALSEDAYDMMATHGHVPLPPYITHTDGADDVDRYQTVFAVLTDLAARGVHTASITLHVGAGTFAPVKTDDLSAHKMHTERYHVPAQTLQAIDDCRSRGGRIIAVGTTSVRAIESWANTGATSGDTDIFITPGYRFQVVDSLITNFHLPKSTLMMLISAFAGYPHVMALYQHAIESKYRFFSYGDAMILDRQ
jgi:S-adenosylmethionine:tRNA ribosyltransferase-isomerase